VGASALMQDPKKFKPVSMLDNGFGMWCGFAQNNSTLVSEVYSIKNSWSDIELVLNPCAYLTSENMLHRVVLGKERVLTNDASSGVGSSAIQLA
jgi:NADPH:quinone reductase-like Zn-dependent oxidoreductase